MMLLCGEQSHSCAGVSLLEIQPNHKGKCRASFFTTLPPARRVTAINLCLACLKTPLLGSALQTALNFVQQHHIRATTPSPWQSAPLAPSPSVLYLQDKAGGDRAGSAGSCCSSRHCALRQEAWWWSRDPPDVVLGVADSARPQPSFLWLKLLYGRIASHGFNLGPGGKGTEFTKVEELLLRLMRCSWAGMYVSC